MAEPARAERSNPVDELTGRSLTMREYLEAVLWWVDRHYALEQPFLGERFADEEERLASLRERVQSIEARKMFRRFAAGEEWQAIRASTRGGELG